MNKPDLRLGFCDYYSPIDEFFISILSPSFNIIRDDDNPDYLIFCDKNFGSLNNKFNNSKVVKIFYTGENERPFHYACDFAISFDYPRYDLSHQKTRMYRLPLYVVEEWVIENKLKCARLIDFYHNLPNYPDNPAKRKFCSFVAANPGCPERNDAFLTLSKYKKIDSAGPLYNNVPIVSRTGYEGIINKTEFLSKYKFNLCYENSSYPGYVTEKIYHAFRANTIPIYWGSPTIEMDFNINSMISRHNFDSFDDMMKEIKRLDKDDDAYYNMVRSNPINMNNMSFDTDRFRRWFRNNVYRG